MRKEEGSIDYGKIRKFLKLGILGALVILMGDFIMGWGVRDMSLKGIASQLSPYLEVSDVRMLLASLFGMLGVPFAVIGHYGIYNLIKPYSVKYARLYGFGNLCFLAFGGAGVHVSSVEASYFYKYLSSVSPETALSETVRFSLFFLVPLYVILLSGWGVMVAAHIRAVLKGFCPISRLALLFSMPIGTLLFSIVGIFGNHALVNAVMMGAFSLGNVWSLSGHLWLIKEK